MEERGKIFEKALKSEPVGVSILFLRHTGDGAGIWSQSFSSSGDFEVERSEQSRPRTYLAFLLNVMLDVRNS